MSDLPDRLRKDHRRNEDGDCRVCVWEPWPCDTARAVAEIDGLHINVQAAVWLMAEKDDRIAELEAENAELRARWDDEITMMDEHATAYDKGYDDALARRERGLSL